MKRQAALFLGFLVFASPVEAADICSDLAVRMAGAFDDFPVVRTDEIEQLVTWRASCAETTPDGPGVVEALCQAGTEGENRVFYWSKVSDQGRSVGYASCLY